MQRQEVPNNTPEQVRDYIVAALELTADLEPPDEMREAVFNAACNLISGKQIVLVQPQPIDLGPLALGGRRH